MNPVLTPAMELALEVTLAFLVVAMTLAFARLVKGPTAPDRIVALDLISGILIGVIGVYSVLTGTPRLLRVAMGLALISFLGTVAVARYLERSAAARSEEGPR